VTAPAFAATTRQAVADAARFLMALSDVLPLLTDDAVALVADRLLGDPDA